MTAPSSPTFEHSYAALSPNLFQDQLPSEVTNPSLITVNTELAEQLNIDPAWLTSQEGINTVAGNAVPQGAKPIATAYAGHQFGNWNPQLGDGRAILLGEVIAKDSLRYDIQLKGAGRTPYSRGGDGRSPLGPVIREYIVSEAMAALGVATTRSLAAVTTGDLVFRDSALPGAILMRVARSHIRFGTLQFFASKQDNETLSVLIEHIITRHYPQAADADNKALALLNCVAEQLAKLISQWQLLGFIHGVMNTDNMLVGGETIDYGPCAFIDEFSPNKVFSSIDQQGRYAYNNQPSIGYWNLACLAQTLLPFLDADESKAVAIAQGAIDQFQDLFLDQYYNGLAIKLGLAGYQEADKPLLDDLFVVMHECKADFTLTFRRLSDLACPEHADTDAHSYRLDDTFLPWLARWHQRLREENTNTEDIQTQMYSHNPLYIPRNHLIAEAISNAELNGDFTVFEQLQTVLKNPYSPQTDQLKFTQPPMPAEVVHRTFCGT